METARDKVVSIQCTVKAVSDVHAKTIFQLASARLLHVHDWSRLTDCLLPMSEHRDHYGRAVSRPVAQEDYFNITSRDTLPFGWMRVEFVVDRTEVNCDEVAVLARQVELPFDQDTLSINGDKPTILRVVRRGLDITASFVTETCAFSAVCERLGVYAVQWRSLVNGLLSDLTPPPGADTASFLSTRSGLSIVR